MADKSDDDICDQTSESSRQEFAGKSYEDIQKQLVAEDDEGRQASQSPPEESIHRQQNNARSSLPVSMNAPFHSGDNPAGNSNEPYNNADGNPSETGNDPSNRGSHLLHCAVVGVAAGTAAVALAPVILSAAGFTAGGVAAGSIAASAQSAFYGGYVASGSVFSLLQSAGAAGIGAATNAAIGGITGGIAALGTNILGRRTDVIKLLICGCGSEAHVFAAIASSMGGTDARVLTSNQNEAERWNAALRNNNLKVTFNQTGRSRGPTTITSKPALVTNNPEDAMKDVHVVAFMPPASAHEGFLNSIKRYIKPGVIIVGLPGVPDFEFQVHEVLGDVARQCTIMKFELSPWECRTTAFGVRCEVLHTMNTLRGATKQGEGVSPRKEPVSTLQHLLGPLPKVTAQVTGWVFS